MHGFDSCSQISTFIGFYIYKNAVVASCEVCFQIFDGFSTQIFFNSLLLGMYNTIFTTLPTIYIILN